MDIKTGLATVSLLAMSNLPSLAERDWLAPLPGAQQQTAADVLKYPDASIDYGSRARVRIYRPDGIYDLRNGRYELSPSGFGDAGTETADD
jgi:hypothetical protein